jgi:hypothetical protein
VTRALLRTLAGAARRAGTAGRALRATPGKRPASSGASPAPWRRQAARPPGFLRRHAVFVSVFLLGAGLRALALYAYRPAFEFSGDSYAYLTLSHRLRPDPVRTAGYPVFLRGLSGSGAIMVVPLVQHLAGLTVGLALYILLVRRRVARPVAAIAAAPVLLDAYQVVIEHFLMAEAVFVALLVAGLVALLWSARPSVWACGVAGGCLAAAALIRPVGAGLGVLAAGYLLARRLGWLRTTTFAVILAVPLAGYASWFHSAHGSYTLSTGDAAWLYGRVAPIADCRRLQPTRAELVLCSPHPPAERPGPNYYVWHRSSPRFRIPVPVPTTHLTTAAQRDAVNRARNVVLTDFAHKVITKQFGDYARVVLADLGHYVAPGRNTGYHDWPIESWRFPTGHDPAYLHVSRTLVGFSGDHPRRVIVEPYAGMLRGYQRVGYTPGPVLAMLALFGCVGVALAGPRGNAGGTRGLAKRWMATGRTATGWMASRWTAARRRRASGERAAAGQDERRRIRWDCALLVATGATTLIVPAATVSFDYRYMLPTLALFPPAAALAARQVQLAGRVEAPSGPAAADSPPVRRPRDISGPRTSAAGPRCGGRCP